MSAREHLAQVLEGTGLYELTGSSPVDWELAAYGAGFALLEERFDQLLGDLVPSHGQPGKAGPVGSSVPAPEGPCQLKGLPGDGPVPARHPAGWVYPAGCAGAAARRRSAGLAPGGGERPHSGAGPVAGRHPGGGPAGAGPAATRHLAWAWEESITWVAWDAYSHSFEEWDSLGLTWAQLDQTVREDLEDYFEEET